MFDWSIDWLIEWKVQKLFDDSFELSIVPNVFFLLCSSQKTAFILTRKAPLHSPCLSSANTLGGCPVCGVCVAFAPRFHSSPVAIAPAPSPAPPIMANSMNLTAGLPQLGGGGLQAAVPDVSASDSMAAPVKTIYISDKHHHEILSSLSALKRNNELCDVSIVVADRQIYAHRAVLAACRYDCTNKIDSSHYATLQLFCCCCVSGLVCVRCFLAYVWCKVWSFGYIFPLLAQIIANLERFFSKKFLFDQVKGPFSGPIDRLIDWLFDWLVERFFDWLIKIFSEICNSFFCPFSPYFRAMFTGDLSESRPNRNHAARHWRDRRGRPDWVCLLGQDQHRGAQRANPPPRRLPSTDPGDSG